MITSLLSSASG